MRVLILGSDFDSARRVASKLENGNSGIQAVISVGTGTEVLKSTACGNYDILLLDRALLDIDGCEALRRIRTARVAKPVMFLSDDADARIKAKVFRAGADGFITRPFDTADLVARIYLLVQRSNGAHRKPFRAGSLELEPGQRKATVGGHPIRLTSREWAILELMLLALGRVLSKETFLNQLYAGVDEPDIKIIDVFICRLRQKLAKAGAGNLIGTEWGRGYVLRDSRDEIGVPPPVPQTGPVAAAAPYWFEGSEGCRLRTSFQLPFATSLASYGAWLLTYGFG